MGLSASYKRQASPQVSSSGESGPKLPASRDWLIQSAEMPKESMMHDHTTRTYQNQENNCSSHHEVQRNSYPGEVRNCGYNIY